AVLARLRRDRLVVEQAVVVAACLLDRLAAHFGGVQRLHGELASLAAGNHCGSPSSLSQSPDISRAASAASQPLLPAPWPVRSTACARFSVVSTPKAMGTRPSAAREKPSVTRSTTASKCAVSPRMTQPNAMIAS